MNKKVNKPGTANNPGTAKGQVKMLGEGFGGAMFNIKDLVSDYQQFNVPQDVANKEKEI